jgi:hypothetical protein
LGRGATAAGAADLVILHLLLSLLLCCCYCCCCDSKVKSEAAEGLLPEFDLGKKVGRKIALQKDRQALVLCVVDVWDFDGSLPRAALTCVSNMSWLHVMPVV